MPSKSSIGTEKTELTEKLKPDTSGKNSESEIYSPENLFKLLPRIELLWLISRDSAKIEICSGAYEELPTGNYLIFRIADDLSIEKGMYQIPRPRIPRKEHQK